VPQQPLEYWYNAPSLTRLVPGWWKWLRSLDDFLGRQAAI